MEYNLKEIGKKLKRERKAAGLRSQDDLAIVIHDNCYHSYTRQTIAKWERGESMPPLDVLLFLCKKYNCELGYLLGEYDTKTRLAYDIGKETGLSERAVACLHEWVIEKELPVNPYNGVQKEDKDSATRFLNVINLLFEIRSEHGESYENVYLLNLIHKFLYSNIIEITAFNQNGSLKKIKDWKFLACKNTDNLNDEFNLHDVEKQIALNKIRDELEAIYKWLHGKS